MSRKRGIRMLLELNFSAVTEAEKIIQEMKDKIDACRSLEDRAVAHLEVSRELSKNLIENGLESNNFNVYRSMLSEIWGLESTPVDVKGLAIKLERTQHELASLDQEYEQLRYEKQEVESKLSMTVESNRELLLKKQELENKIKELEGLTDSLDNSQQLGLVHEDNLEIVRAGHLLTQEVNELKSQLEKLTAENNFYSQENASLKKQKLEWVVNKDENQRIAQLESKIAELESENQSLEWQKNKAVAMVEEKVEQAIPQASWEINDIVQVIGTGEVVKIVNYPEDNKLGHFACLMPDGETKKSYFTGQLRFVQSGNNAVNPPTTPQTEPELPMDLGVVEVVGNEIHVPSHKRAHEFIKSYKIKTTTWEHFQKFAQKDSQVLKDISMSKLKNKLRVKTALPGLFGDYVLRTGDTSDLAWLNSPTFDKVATEAISKRGKQELEQSLQADAQQFFATHNSPKKLGNIKWETVRNYAQGDGNKIDALIKCASASAGNKENSKTQFCDNLERLHADYIIRTGDNSDLQWVPFATVVIALLDKNDNTSELANHESETTSLEGKISDCKTVEQLEETSGRNPSNIKDADDAGVIVDIYEIHIERTGEFDKLNWLPESIQDEIYQRLGRGTRPLDFEIGEKVRGVDLYSAYCSKAGVVTRLTPGLISVAWEDGKFNTHYAEDLEIIPESLALQVA